MTITDPDVRQRQISHGLLCPACPGRAWDITGIELSGVYDGVAYWECRKCRHQWHRFPEGHPVRAKVDEARIWRPAPPQRPETD